MKRLFEHKKEDEGIYRKTLPPSNEISSVVRWSDGLVRYQFSTLLVHRFGVHVKSKLVQFAVSNPSTFFSECEEADVR